MDRTEDQVQRPAHYTYSAIEPIAVIEAWQLGFHLGNVVKYIARARHKGHRLEDLRKARWYLQREITRMEEDSEESEAEETESSICPECNGIGTSRNGNRPDDYGPHFICFTCRGTGLLRPNA